MFRVTPFTSYSTLLRPKTVHLGKDSLKVFEVIPVEKGKNSTSTITYGRIKSLNRFTFMEIIKAKSKEEDYKKTLFGDSGEYYFFKYDTMPKLYILKSDGRIYTEQNNDIAKYEAFRLLRMLVKFGYVEGYKRRTFRRE